MPGPVRDRLCGQTGLTAGSCVRDPARLSCTGPFPPRARSGKSRALCPARASGAPGL